MNKNDTLGHMEVEASDRTGGKGERYPEPRCISTQTTASVREGRAWKPSGLLEMLAAACSSRWQRGLWMGSSCGRGDERSVTGQCSVGRALAGLAGKLDPSPHLFPHQE